MHLCPYCAEEIQDAAIKCKHCGEFLPLSEGRAPTQQAVKWYFKPLALFIILGSIGPFGLPLIWLHPKLKIYSKIIITLLILLITWFAVIASVEATKLLNETYNEYMQLLNP